MCGCGRVVYILKKPEEEEDNERRRCTSMVAFSIVLRCNLPAAAHCPAAFPFDSEKRHSEPRTATMPIQAMPFCVVQSFRA